MLVEVLPVGRAEQPAASSGGLRASQSLAMTLRKQLDCQARRRVMTSGRPVRCCSCSTTSPPSTSTVPLHTHTTHTLPLRLTTMESVKTQAQDTVKRSTALAQDAVTSYGSVPLVPPTPPSLRRPEPDHPPPPFAAGCTRSTASRTWPRTRSFRSRCSSSSCPRSPSRPPSSRSPSRSCTCRRVRPLAVRSLTRPSHKLLTYEPTALCAAAILSIVQLGPLGFVTAFSLVLAESGPSSPPGDSTSSGRPTRN